MRETPVLLLAYNRADKVRDLIDRLRPQAPRTVLVAVDGPKSGQPADAARVEAVHRELERIDWTDRVDTLLRPENLGLRRAVAGAVTWAIDAYGQAIVIEEDVLPGRDWIPYATRMLERHRQNDRIAHISGYSVVPPAHLRREDGSRLTRYPESIAWATWDRAWTAYDPDMTWARQASVAELAELTGSRLAGLRWRQLFADAAAERVQTWAYRWIASMWSRGWFTLSPNRSLVAYAGYDEGTHTATRRASWDEQPLWEGGLDEVVDGVTTELDPGAEAYQRRVVFGGTVQGLARGAASSAVLGLRRRVRLARARRGSGR